MSDIVQQRIPFKLLLMPCCGGIICHVNHRWPSYCSNCGTRVYPEIKGCASISDENALLQYDNSKQT